MICSMILLNLVPQMVSSEAVGDPDVQILR